MYTCKKKLAYILEWTKLGWMFWRENSNHFCTLLSKIEGQKFWNGQKTPYTTSVHSNSYISKKHIHVRKKWDAFQTGPRLCKVVLARKFKSQHWPIFLATQFWNCDDMLTPAQSALVFIFLSNIYMYEKIDILFRVDRAGVSVLARKFKLNNWPIFPFSFFWTG